MTSKFFVETNQAVGVFGLVQRTQPFKIGVPTAKPCLTIRWPNLQSRVFKHLQWQTGLPGHCFKMQLAHRVLAQMFYWQVTKA